MGRSVYQGQNYETAYAFDNYMIEDRKNSSSNICVIYCSSSGLYYPNTEEEFIKAFIDRKDKFEWRNHRVKDAAKSIWIRDITKEFYVRGINKRICTIDKLIDFLRGETEGYDVITVGSSSGGYIATVIGCLLHAKRVLSFSGFFDLDIIDKDTWPLVAECAQFPAIHKWYRLHDLIKSSDTLIFYFCSHRLKVDCLQAEGLNLDNVKIFRFDSSVHGIPFKKDWHRISILNRVLNFSERKR